MTVCRTNCSGYLCLHPISLQSRHHFLQELIDSEWHVFRDKVNSPQGSVGKESILSKEGFNGGLKSFSLHTNLLG